MLIVGNTPYSKASRTAGMHCRNLTLAEERTQLAIWSLASAPLFMSNDLPRIPAASRRLLLNPELLAIDQECARTCTRGAPNSEATHLHALALTPTIVLR